MPENHQADPFYTDEFDQNDPEFAGLTWDDIMRMSQLGRMGPTGTAEAFAARLGVLMEEKNKQQAAPPAFWLGRETEPEAAPLGDIAGPPVDAPVEELLPPAAIDQPAVPQDPALAPKVDEGAFPDEGPMPLTKKERRRANLSAAFGEGLKARVRMSTPTPTAGPATTGPPSSFTIVDRDNSIYQRYLKLGRGKYSGNAADMMAQMKTLNYYEGTAQNPSPYSLGDVRLMFATGEKKIADAIAVSSGAQTDDDKALVVDLINATKRALESLDGHAIDYLKTQKEYQQRSASLDPNDKAWLAWKLSQTKEGMLERFYRAWSEGGGQQPDRYRRAGGQVRTRYYTLRQRAEGQGIEIAPLNDLILGLYNDGSR